MSEAFLLKHFAIHVISLCSLPLACCDIDNSVAFPSHTQISMIKKDCGAAFL